MITQVSETEEVEQRHLAKRVAALWVDGLIVVVGFWGCIVNVDFEIVLLHDY